jgi:hypothetical protein
MVEGVEGRIEGGVVLAEVQEAADQGADGAGKGVAAAAMSKHLAANAIFLVVEGEGGARDAG